MNTHCQSGCTVFRECVGPENLEYTIKCTLRAEVPMHRHSFDCGDGFEIELKGLNNQSIEIYDNSYKNSPFFSSALLAGNADKNRYCNILPIEKTRVRLRDRQEDGVCDYINANHIDYREKEAGTHVRPMIAAQGPMSGTVSDFWKMVWDQGTDHIVMLCSPDQCAPYHPTAINPHGVRDVGCGVGIELVKEEKSPCWIHRTFLLSSASLGEQRAVHHYEFFVWEDYGVPESPDMLQNLVQAVHKSASGTADRAGPIVVHCSAGIGRTGTFMGAYIQYQKWWRSKALGRCDEHIFDIMGDVHWMRQQRAGMIQTKEQYRYLYESVLSEVRPHKPGKNKM